MTYIFYTTLFRASSLEAISLEAFVFLPFTEHFEAEKKDMKKNSICLKRKSIAVISYFKMETRR